MNTTVSLCLTLCFVQNAVYPCMPQWLHVCPAGLMCVTLPSPYYSAFMSVTVSPSYNEVFIYATMSSSMPCFHHLLKKKINK